MGISGMQSQAFEHFMGGLCAIQGVELRDCFANSLMASRSVDAMRVLNLISFFMSFPPNRR